MFEASRACCRFTNRGTGVRRRTEGLKFKTRLAQVFAKTWEGNTSSSLTATGLTLKTDPTPLSLISSATRCQLLNFSLAASKPKIRSQFSVLTPYSHGRSNLAALAHLQAVQRHDEVNVPRLRAAALRMDEARQR